ncbi:coiled-coil domain-containing protein 187 isoform X1 [Corythoichthys intestinalis]|uniref:coiled-coil domain-containing protein 187 isoform X1 n=1 Tax=Corythoichthys intestinalis TaxID=161448 RepID=UPI0025A4E3C7|nr:coiled-coil domain-containing protein 187 isoform X1 [Corythoichthys intestinalis]
MAELQIDQSNLPRVQEVCQSFAVLEDGVLAHTLQEQEIEQYYTTNIQKSQLVQNDIRVAKQLQDEEEQKRALQRAVLRQESRQLEEQDHEYACVIQEEIRRRAEEDWRREQDDEEMAKQMQAEEERRMRRARAEEERREGSSSDSASSSPRQRALSRRRLSQAQDSHITARWQYCNSPNSSDYYNRPPPPYYPRTVAVDQTATSWSNEGHAYSRGQLMEELEESLHENSVFFEQRLSKRHNTAPLHRRSSLRLPCERNYRSLHTPSRIAEESDGWEQYYDNGGQEKRRAGDWEQEMNNCVENGTQSIYDDQNRTSGSSKACEQRWRRSKSVRIPVRSRHGGSDSSRTWSYRENTDKRVHFAADAESADGHPNAGSRVWEMLGHVLRERGVPVSFGSSGAPLKIGRQSQDGRTELHGSDPQPHPTQFKRSASSRHSFHGDMRQWRLTRRESKGSENGQQENDALGDIRGTRRWERPNLDKGSATSEGLGERLTGRNWHKTIKDRLSSEEEVERKAPRRTLSASWVRSRLMAAGASLVPKKRQTSLDLGDLQQVLCDEELARKLQEQESKLLTRTSQSRQYNHSPHGDFRVAQVAQDEEIARYMQKQEIKSNRLSRQMEGPASWREHRAMMSHHDRRMAREKMMQRERLDSEGLPSPTEDYSPENQPPSPISTLEQSQQVRNIAEDLDPTFQAKSQEADILQTGQNGTARQSLPDVQDLLGEATFIPPTKRQKDKAGRTKSKEKKENCKQQ